jgi:hypothetical protein
MFNVLPSDIIFDGHVSAKYMINIYIQYYVRGQCINRVNLILCLMVVHQTYPFDIMSEVGALKVYIQCYTGIYYILY